MNRYLRSTHLQQRSRWRLALRAAAATLATVCCPVFGSVELASATGAPPSLAKSYSGSAHNTTAAESGAIVLKDIVQAAGSISGTFSFESPLAGTGPFTGNITSTAIKFTVKPTAVSCPSCTSIVFAGTVWPIVSMSGTWVAHLKSGGAQGGTWGLPSTYDGTVYNNQAKDTSHVSFTLNEKANGHLTGSEFDQYGYGTGPLTGTLRGSKVEITNHQPVQYTGTWSTLGGMSGTWSGAGATGNWQLRRSGAQTAI